MSFPPANTTANSTKQSAGKGFVLGPDDGDAYWWLGSLTLNKVTRASTKGDLDIVDHRVPAGYAPPPHIHRSSDEVFYIIDGTFGVMCGDDHWQAGPGSLVFLPRGTAHGFTVTDDGPGRTLLFNAPAGFADLIVDLGQPTTKLVLPGPDVPMPSPEEAGKKSEKHGIFPA